MSNGAISCIALAFVALLVAVTAGTTVDTYYRNDRLTRVAAACLMTGGSWLPAGGRGNEFQCIRSR